MKLIPHIITAGNLFCGILALVFLSEGRLLDACYLVFLAGLLDFLDGLVARALGVSGDFGKQLDSLADAVTFGVVPAFLLYSLSDNFMDWPFAKTGPNWLKYVPLLIGIFSAWRLAKFNIDERQTSGFIGLPTPANAFWLCGLPFLLHDYPALLRHAWLNPWSIALLALLSCFLLVSPLRMISLKIKTLALKPNLLRYLLLFSMAVLLILFKFAALLALVPVYVIFSIIDNQLKNNEIHG